MNFVSHLPLFLSSLCPSPPSTSYTANSHSSIKARVDDTLIILPLIFADFAPNCKHLWFDVQRCKMEATTSRNSLGNLPIELKSLIVNHLYTRQDLENHSYTRQDLESHLFARQDFWSLCLVSKTFNSLAIPLLYRDIVLQFDNYEIALGAVYNTSRFLATLAQGNSPGLLHIRNVDIVLVSEEANPEWERQYQLLFQLLRRSIPPKTLRSLR